MRRRDVITLLGGAAAALPSFVALAQVPTKHPLIALLFARAETVTQQLRSGFARGMQELGYVEGRDYVVEDRYADGDLARLPAIVEELVRLKPDVIVTGTTVGARAVKRVTGTIPIVGASLTDPVGFGLAASLARPGDQVTGILLTSDSPTFSAQKRLELALEVVPGARKIGLLVNVSNQSNAVYRRNLEAAAAARAVQLVPSEVRASDDLDAVFQALTRGHVEFVVVLEDGLFVSEHRRIVTLAAAARLPALYAYREFVDAGGLMTYGVNLRESWRRAATFVDKIINGAKPADLPIEQPTFELVINMKTAKALGLTIPQSQLLRADELID
jgi:putative ABC transport system substrate-binding protein